MGKGKQEKKKKQTSSTSVYPNAVAAEEWKHIIASALVEAEAEKIRLAEDQKKKDSEKWRETIGIKDYSQEKTPKRWILDFLNILRFSVTINFISREKIKGDRMTFIILQLFLQLFFAMVHVILLFASIILIFVFPIIIFNQHGVSYMSLGYIAISIVVGFSIFLLSGTFRIAGIEIENIDDRNYMFGLFACITALVSLVLPIITIIKKG